MPVDALRTATSEVPSSSLEEGRGWICLPRTGDAVPRGCLGSVLWGVLSVPCMWHCHGKLCCEQGPWRNCTAHICVTGESSPVHTQQCRINVSMTQTRTGNPGYASSTLSSPTPNANCMVCHKHQLLFLYFIVFSLHTTNLQTMNLALLPKKKKEQTTAIHGVT